MQMPEVERNRPVPIYQQIKEWIQTQILDRNWPEHYKLPAEVDLARSLGVSRGTVRKAVAELTTEGLLVSVHGRGTFVGSPTLEQALTSRLVTSSEDLTRRGIPYTTRVLEQTVTQPGSRVTSLLSIPDQSRVFFIRRVRLVEQSPIALLHNYVVYDRCVGIEAIDFTRHQLFQVLEEKFGLPVTWGQRTFEAQVPHEELKAPLPLPEGTPVMYMEQITYLDDDVPIELSDVWWRGDQFRLSATVGRNPGRRTLKVAQATHSVLSIE